MKINKRFAGVLLAIMTIVMTIPMQVMAAGRIDLERDIDFSIAYQNGDTPIIGAGFDIYLVATVDEYGELTTTDDFAQFNVDIRGENDDAWKTLASTLQGYVLRDNISPADSGKTDQQGVISFSSAEKKLTPGLYLVLASRHTQDGYIYEALPTVVMLPSLDKENNDWVYEVTANPKFESTPVPKDEKVTRKVMKIWKDEGHEKDRPKEIVVQLLQDNKIYDTVTLSLANNWSYTWEELDASYRWTVVEKETKGYTVAVNREGATFMVTNTYDTPKMPSKTPLPQTGQLWWPVPVLIIAGLFAVVIGLFLRRGAENER